MNTNRPEPSSRGPRGIDRAPRSLEEIPPEVRALVERSRREQGLPVGVEDPQLIARAVQVLLSGRALQRKRGSGS